MTRLDPAPRIKHSKHMYERCHSRKLDLQIQATDFNDHPVEWIYFSRQPVFW